MTLARSGQVCAIMAAMPSTSTPDLGRAIDAAIHGYRRDGSVPGLALAITDRHGVVLARVAGLADVAAGRPVTPDTLFEVGSIGKAFTAVTILQLQAESRLSIDDPVVRHLPWFRVPRHGDTITLHHLLSHTAGITAGVDGTPEATFQVWRLRDLPPGSRPGRRFHYSNVGYKVLGLVIEAIEGEPYPEVIRRRVLRLAEMATSEPAITNDIRHRLAVGYAPARDDLPWTEGDPLTPATWLETGTADGSVAATGTDLAAFVRFLMTDTTGTVERMATSVPALQSDGYGYALLPRTIDGRGYLGHGGGMVGYIAGMQWDPEAGIGAVVLQNGPGHNPNALARLAIRQTRAVRDGRDPAAESMEPAEAFEDEAPPRVTITGIPAMDQAVVAGWYRSHDPWIPVFRVESRGPELWLVFTAAPDGFEDAQPLVPMARGWFRVGTDRLGPERLRFDTVIDGRARRAWLSGWDYYRVDPSAS
jgi:CubicO group peptidase (beta-lactamase class C family)